MKTPKKMPCPKNGRPLWVVSLESGVLSAFCMYCSCWHNWTHKDLEQIAAKKRR